MQRIFNTAKSAKYGNLKYAHIHTRAATYPDANTMARQKPFYHCSFSSSLIVWKFEGKYMRLRKWYPVTHMPTSSATATATATPYTTAIFSICLKKNIVRFVRFAMKGDWTLNRNLAVHEKDEEVASRCVKVWSLRVYFVAKIFIRSWCGTFWGFRWKFGISSN